MLARKKKWTMKLSPVIARYFDSWICHDTWDSHHLFDRERFYRFVKAVARYSRRAPLPGDVQALIVDRWRHRRVRTALHRATERYGALYQTLLEYERTRGFPDALIERTNIVRYYLRLAPRSPNAQHFDRTMTNVWGKDWQKKLEAKL